MKKFGILVTVSFFALSACTTLEEAGSKVSDMANRGADAIGGVFSESWANAVQEGQLTALANEQASLPASQLASDPEADAEYEAATSDYQKTVGQGAVLGGVLAGVGCALLTDANDTQTALCVAGGALLGGLVGESVAERNQALVEDRESVMEELEFAEANRAAAQRVLDATESKIAFLQEEVERLDARLAAGTITEEQYRSDMIQAKKESVALASNLNAIMKDIEAQGEVFEDLKIQTAASEDVNVRATTPLVEKEFADTTDLLEVEFVATQTQVAEFQEELGTRGV